MTADLEEHDLRRPGDPEPNRERGWCGAFATLVLVLLGALMVVVGVVVLGAWQAA